MKYMILFNESAETFAERGQPGDTPYWAAWGSYMAEMGPLILSGHALQGPETASTLRRRDGRQTIQDGPTPDSKEMIGGYVILDLPDLDAALHWAGKAPCADTGSVSVIPILPMMG